MYLAKDRNINLLFNNSERVLRNLIESVQSGVYMADKEGNLFFVNQAFVNILGFSSKEEILGLNLARQIYAHPQDREDFLKAMERTGFVRDYEVKNKRKDGSVVVLSVTSNFIRNDSGAVIGVEGIVQDITGKKRLEENLIIEKSRLEQILCFDEKIISIHNLNQLVDFVVNRVSEILNAGKCSIMLLDESNNRLCIKGAKGLSDDIIETTQINIGESIEGWVAREGEPVLVSNIEYDKRFKRANRSSYLSRSFMSIPIKLGKKVIGVINVSDKNLDPNAIFDELDLKILCAISREVAVALENAKLYKELEYLSNVDPITYLYNYRHFVKALDLEIGRVKRYQGPLSIMMIDIDDFKRYNDRFGHLQGDLLLRRLADILKSNLRTIDTLSRYGGDEFVVILPETNLAQAKLVAEKLRNRVEEAYFKDKVTISIGVAEYQDHFDRFELTVKADRAMYEAKKAGKKRIFIANHSM